MSKTRTGFNFFRDCFGLLPLAIGSFEDVVSTIMLVDLKVGLCSELDGVLSQVLSDGQFHIIM